MYSLVERVVVLCHLETEVVGEVVVLTACVRDLCQPARRRGMSADTVRNLDAWYDAFMVKPRQKLYLAPAERVKIW